MSDNNIDKVEIVDIKMSFWSMVVFMVKAAVASIPAMIILIVIGTLAFGLLGGLFVGLAGLPAPK